MERALESGGKDLAGRVEELTGYKLLEFQRRAVEVIDGTDDNVLVIAPTGAGKSIIGYAALLKHRGFYLTPLIAIMNEKLRDMKDVFGRAGYSVVMTNRDYRIPFKVVKEADVRIMSPYKFLTYINSFSKEELRGQVVVFDELHTMSRDPLFEAALTIAKERGLRIVGLSATINEEDRERLARWLKARLVVETKRPVELRHVPVLGFTGYGGYRVASDLAVDGKTYLTAGEVFRDRYAAAAELAARLWATAKRPVIVWAPTRRLVEELASLIADRLRERIMPSKEFIELSERVPDTSGANRLLRNTLPYGVWIHHGGLAYSLRSFIEENYRKHGGVIVTAYTLSHGVNLPGTFLVISTLYDFERKPLDASMFHQISGRAGRPGYDDVGTVITVLDGELDRRRYEMLLSEAASRIEPAALSDDVTAVKLGLVIYSAAKSMDEVRRIFTNTYQYFIGRASDERVDELLGEVREAAAFYRRIGTPAAAVAMYMGIHPDEYAIIDAALRSNTYQEFIREILPAAARLARADLGEVSDDITTYGFLATILGRSPASREVAELIQSVIEAGAFWAWRAFGYKSKEHEKLLTRAKEFAYAGNPYVEPLASGVRIDVLRRMIKAVPEIVSGFSGRDDAEKVIQLTALAVKEAYINRRIVSRRNVAKLVGLTFYALSQREAKPGEVARAVERVITELKNINKDLRVRP